MFLEKIKFHTNNHEAKELRKNSQDRLQNNDINLTNTTTTKNTKENSSIFKENINTQPDEIR